MSHGPEALDPLLVRVKVSMYLSREVEMGNGPSPGDANELAELIVCQPAEIGRASQPARHQQMNLKGF